VSSLKLCSTADLVNTVSTFPSSSIDFSKLFARDPRIRFKYRTPKVNLLTDHHLDLMNHHPRVFVFTLMNAPFGSDSLCCVCRGGRARGAVRTAQTFAEALFKRVQTKQDQSGSWGLFSFMFSMLSICSCLSVLSV